jgi:thiamine-phosphate pyrophosphorylase
MRLQIPKVYAITDTRLSGLSHADQVARLIEGGATLIQLRDKHDSPRDFLRAAEAAFAVAEKQSVRIIINDRVDIAMALSAPGVHLGQSDLPAECAHRLLPQSVIGVSTHNLAQVQDAARMSVDYIAFGPIFSTGTKADREPVVGLNLLHQAKQLAGDLPLVAIGGITAENCLEVLQAGADSVAVISALVSDSAKISENTRRMLSLAAG